MAIDMESARDPWPRRSGLLLHFTSLPGPGGAGDLGPAARQFLADLHRGGQRSWQVLPTGPTGYGDSPYQTSSVLALNPIFLSPQDLVRDGLLDASALDSLPPASAHADFDRARRLRVQLARQALSRLAMARAGQGGQGHLAHLVRELDAYLSREQRWLDEYTLFTAIKDEQGGASWTHWPAPLRDRDPAALSAARERLRAEIELHAFLQWLLDRQFRALRSEANAAGIELIGDVPIFVAHDSVEVWSAREQFQLHADGSLRVQAGVPPDYFSRTGQLWGNPLYDWSRMQADGFAFFRQRIARTAQQFDRVRIDHFRGFAAYWEVPGQARTAEHGRWVEAPGAALFTALANDPETARVRYIAEDLGVITPDVEELRDRFALPGIRVLQFGFGPDDHYDGRPWAMRKNAVVYTSTHDNAPIVAWYRGDADGTRREEEARADRERVHAYLGYVPAPHDVHWALNRLAMATAADTVIMLVQDVLGLGAESRINTPGKSEGNWGFRLLPGQLDGGSLDTLRELTRIYGRLR